MPSSLHEELILLFRNRSELATELLKRARVDVPEYTEIRVESEDLTDLKPAAYRADLVLLLLKEKQRALGIIVEVQLSVDTDKQYTWPAYLANFRARIRCPVYLLVIAVEERVARWAGAPIELGGGSRVVPWVMGPDNIPAVTDQREAEEKVELAVLSAQAHARNVDVQLATRIAAAAIVASVGIDGERSKMYLDLVLRSMPQGSRQESQAMSQVIREREGDWALRYFYRGRETGESMGRTEGRAEGRIEGRTEGRAEIILKLLTLRFGPLTAAATTHVREACNTESGPAFDSVLAANTLDEALDAM